MQGRHCASSSSGIFLTKFTNIPYVYCLCGIATLLVQYSGTGSFAPTKQWVLYYAGIQIITQRNSLPVPFANLWFFEGWRISLRLSVYKFFDVDGFQLFQVGCVNVFHLFVYVFLPHMLWQLTGQGRFQAGY